MSDVDVVENDVLAEILVAVMRVGLRGGTPAGLASALRAGLALEAGAGAAGGDLAAVAVPGAADQPEPKFDWIYR
jgi:hypothetical protein